MKRPTAAVQVRALAIASLWALLWAALAGADDREILRSTPSEASLFILLDVGASMGRSVSDQVLARGADDDGSRLYMSKQALVAALDRVSPLSFGLATYPNQDGLHVIGKGAAADRVELSSLAADASCSGWEPNGDDASDSYQDHSLKWPTESSGAPGLSVGDVVPAVPGARGRELLRGRLAPNLALDLADGVEPPDVGIARYFSDIAVGGLHPLVKPLARPLVPWGDAPIAAALRSFGAWLGEWAAATGGAASCRRIDLLILSGGPDGCGGLPAPEAARLLSGQGVRTHVVALGVADPVFDAIAAAGGTGAAHQPTTQEELDEAIAAVFAEVAAESLPGASGRLSTGTTGGRAQVVHSSLEAIEGAPFWSGRVDAYLRPVPLAAVDGVSEPDRGRVCDGSTKYGCRAWDAGEELLEQAPSSLDVERGDLKLGNGIDQRRVFYLDRHGERRLLLPPTEPEEQVHLYGPGGLGLDPAGEEFVALGREIVEGALSIRAGEGGSYLLGDAFHSQPVLIGSPRRLDYLASDSEGRLEPCGPRFDGVREDRVPYGCFARFLSRRRRMLAVGANDGQLHLFDAGVPATDGVDGATASGAGGGRELFAFAPRAALEPVRSATLTGSHRFSVDGTVAVDDFLRAGDPGAVREWRTALVGGLREGGSGYYALDVTQPDRLDADGLPAQQSYVPSCLDAGSGCGMPSPFAGLPDLEGEPFPTVLWEFVDAEDEDRNGAPDLGQTWSRPATGRIRTSTGDRFVAIFGGGMDPEFKRQPRAGDGAFRPWRGNFLYMVDLETGTILYKRALDRPAGEPQPASVPSGPAAVDIDSDGYLDTIYVGTTAGFLFKVDLRSSGELGSGEGRIDNAGWTPFPVFDTGDRPIYHAPSVLYLAGSGQVAVAFGTGDREDLWAQSGVAGYLYVFVDEGLGPESAPLSASALEPLEHRGRTVEPGLNLLTEPLDEAQRAAGRVAGWHMRLELEERLLAPTIAAGGVLVFNTYLPSRPGLGPECGGSGGTRTYAVVATNGNPVAEESRFSERQGVLAMPMVDVELSMPLSEADEPGPPSAGGQEPCAGEAVKRLRERLIEELHPPGCRPGRRALEVIALDSASDRACVVSLPVCVVRRHWRER